MSELFKDIPEFVEVGRLGELLCIADTQVSIGESVTARTETLGVYRFYDLRARADIQGTFRELGPPDLCHVIKSSGSKAAQKDVSVLWSWS